jgi:ABC-2 type transport system permease protein
MLVPAIVTQVQSKDKSVETVKNIDKKDVVYIIDKSGYFKNKINEISKDFPEYKISQAEEDKFDSLKTEVKQNDNSFLVVVNSVDGIPSVDFYTKQYGQGPDTEKIGTVFKKLFILDTLKSANVSESVTTKVLGDVNVKINELGKSKWGGYFSSIFIVIILFFAIYFNGYGVSMSVASEKTSRVMELLVTSVRPSRIILGKTAGMGAVGLVQMLLIILVGAATYKLAFPPDFTFGGMRFDLSNFTPLSLVMFIVYFVLGYSLYALMYAVVGATVSKAEDVNSAIMPISFITMIAFYVSYGTFAIPDSVTARVASLVPLTSPFSVPSRLISTNVPAWELLLSLFILIISILIVAVVSVKLYSFAVLHYGDRLKLSKLFKISRESRIN